MRQVTAAARAERGDRHAEASALYEAGAAETADPAVARTALYRAAQAAERAGEAERALGIYRELYEGSPGTPEAGRALYDAGRLLQRTGREADGRALLWRLVRQEPACAVVEVGMRRLYQAYGDDGALASYEAALGAELAAAGDHPVGVGLLYFRAHARNDLGRVDDALADLEEAHRRCPYPDCSFWDDVLWVAAQFALDADRPAAALAYLDRLLHCREEGWFFTGTFYSVFYDDAQILKGEILLDRLDDPEGAAAAFLGARDMSDSVLRDDGLFRAARVHIERLGDAERGCGMLRELLTAYPDSNRTRETNRLLARPPCAAGEESGAGER